MDLIKLIPLLHIINQWLAIQLLIVLCCHALLFAVDLIPNDIVICDWHYGKQSNYPSVPFLLEKGFRVWPSSWQPLDGAKAFSAFSRAQKNAQLIGFLCTVWGKVKIDAVSEWPPFVEVLAEWK